MIEMDRRTVLGAALGLSAAAAATSTTASAQSGGLQEGEGETPPSSAAQEQAAGIDPARPLAGRVAFVTGGARVIGLASAIELARLGADVALVDIADPTGVAGVEAYPLASREDLAEAERRVRAEGVRALGLVADVRDLDALTRAAERTVAELGGLDVVAAVAGVNLSDDTLESYGPGTWDAIIEVNVRGVLHTVKAALPGLRRRPGGRVVIVSSVAGRRGSVDSLVYSTSKWAVTGLMKGLAAELGPGGITVNCVAPSGVDTVLFAKGRDQETIEAEAADGAVLPVSILQPADIGRAVAFLAGPGGRWMSGVTLDVNAGRSAENLG